jgi:predicted permease
VETWWQDLRYGCRMLRKSPGFTAIALLMLAIGIGANTIMFTLADLLLFRPVMLKDPGQLVCCRARDLVVGGIPYSAYQTIRDSAPVFAGLMAQDDGMTEVTLVRNDSARPASAAFVTANCFSLLGVSVRGRGFLPQEEREGGPPSAVLSYRAWQRLDSDPKVLGSTILVNGVSHQVVGIAPPGFTGVTVIGPDLWLPLGSWLPVIRVYRGGTRASKDRGDIAYPGSLRLVGRLKPGLSMSAAQSQLAVLVPRLREAYPDQWSDSSSLYLHRPPRLSMAGDEREQAALAYVSLVLMGISTTILLIACLNLASMLSVQGMSRYREIATRMALGGGRGRIARQLLIESLLLALLGGACGLVLAYWGTAILNAWIGGLHAPEMGNFFKPGLNGRVLVATLGFCVVTTLLFGLRPSLGLLQRDVANDLKESGIVSSGPAKRGRYDLSVFCQIALAVVLVMGAALFSRSALQLACPNPGLRLDNKLAIQIDPFAAGYDLPRSTQLCETLADRLASLPGVERLGTSPSFCFGGPGPWSIDEYARGDQNSPEGRNVAEYASIFEVGENYFAALDLPLLQGRPFGPLDSAPGAERVVIIDESLARKLRPDGNALGCWIQYTLLTMQSDPYRVVGIVRNVQSPGEVKEIHAQIYRPVRSDQACRYFYLRVADTTSATMLMQRVTEEIRAVDPHMPILSITTLAERERDNLFAWSGRFCARLTIAAATAALFLAALGIYAIKGYRVASRTREIGIRKALGATSTDIVAMVFRDGLVLLGVALLAGLGLGLCAVRVVASQLYGVNAVDPLSIGATLAILGIASILATYVPARRAAKVDPMVALRYE